MRPPGGRHWWRGRPSQQFVGKGTFRAPRTGVLDRFGPLERELARPRTRALRTRSLRADVCLNRRSSQVNTRARYSCANQKNAQQPLYLQSWPRKSSKCSSRSRSSARARARVLLHHGPFTSTRDRRRRDVSASARRRGGRPTPSPRRRAGGRVCSSWWPRQLAGVEGDAYDFAPSRPQGRRSSPHCRI